MIGITFSWKPKIYHLKIWKTQAHNPSNTTMADTHQVPSKTWLIKLGWFCDGDAALVLGTSHSFFQPWAILVSFISCNSKAIIWNSHLWLFFKLMEMQRHAQSVTHQTPVRWESEVNFSPLMVQGARQAAQLQAALSLLSRHKTENRFSLQHILRLQTLYKPTQ